MMKPDTRFRNDRQAAGLVCALLALALATPAAAQQALLWSDEFDRGEVPDPATWSYDLGANGWGNNELQAYTDDPENARIRDGELVIRALPQATGAPFTSARIRTQDKVTFRYGTLEARIKVPDLADGLWPAFWTLGNNFSQVGWPACGELDILEMGHVTAIGAGLANRRVGSAAHWENNDNYATYGLFYDAPQRLDDDYHLYRLEWTPDFVRTYVDDALVWEMAIDERSCTDCTEFHEPHFVILNLAVGGNYTGILAESGITAPLPAEMKVDYVRIYDNGYTEVEGPGVIDNAVGPAHSGSWYQPAQDGHGFSIEVGNAADGSPLAVVYWYTYDVDGNPLFMLGTGVPDGTGLDVGFFSPYGMKYGEFDPASVVEAEGGNGRFVFSDRDNGVFSYQPSAFTRDAWGHGPIESLPIEKLFSIPVSGSATTR
jgi:beta-glucanase (GH16 family)